MRSGGGNLPARARTAHEHAPLSAYDLGCVLRPRRSTIMPVVVGIRFKDSGKTYFFDPNSMETLLQGDHVIVETVRGLELAKVAYAPHMVADEAIVGELKTVIRRADDADFA